MSELEMATTPELINELKKRMSSLLLMGMSDIGTDPEASHGKLFSLCFGNPFEVMGLAVAARDTADDYLHGNLEINADEHDE